MSIQSRPDTIRDNAAISELQPGPGLVREPAGADPVLFVRLTADLHEAVKETAVREDRTMSSVVREAVRQYVRRSERKTR